MDASPSPVRAQAFKTYVEPEIEVLLRVGLALTGSAAEAEDLVQDTLVRAWGAVERFDGAYPRAWLLTILRNTHRNRARRRRPDLVHEAHMLPGARPAFGIGEPASPEDLVVDRTLEAPLERAVAALDPRFRTVLLLVDVDGFSYAETAQALDIPVGTVMSRLSRARTRVRTHLTEGSSR